MQQDIQAGRIGRAYRINTGDRAIKAPAISFLSVLLVLTGCVQLGRVDTDPVPVGIERTFRSGAVDLEQVQSGGITLAGVVVRDGARLNRYPDLPPLDEEFGYEEQTEFWRRQCERKFAEKVTDVSLKPYPRFDDLVVDELKIALWKDYAEGGGISPALLDSIHAAAPGVRYLLIARVDYDDISQDIETGSIPDSFPPMEKRASATKGHDPNRVANSMCPTIKRVVGLTMGLFDLETSRCVWESGTIENIKASAARESLSGFSGIRTEKTEDGKLAISSEDAYPGAPPFGSVLDKCLGAIYYDMFQGTNCIEGPPEDLDFFDM